MKQYLFTKALILYILNIFFLMIWNASKISYLIQTDNDEVRLTKINVIKINSSLLEQPTLIGTYQKLLRVTGWIILLMTK